MAAAKMTLIGLYRWDNTLFNDMVLPAGIDKDLLVDSLLLRGGEFEVLYPDPDFMKMSIGIWSKKWYRTFSEWLRGTQATWNPIYNYDRYEDGRDEGRKKFDSLVSTDYTDTRTANLQDKRTADLQDKRTDDLTDKRTADLQDKRTADLQDKRSADLQDERTPDLNEKTEFNNADVTTQMTDGTTEHKVAAYDSSSYSPSSKDIINNGDSKVEHSGTVTNITTGSDTTKTTGTDTMNHTGTDTTDHTGTDTTEHSGTETTNHTGTDTTDHTGTDAIEHKGTLSDTGGSEQNSNIHSAHMYGNIGVTTSAAMLREFYDISSWNLYEHIADVFTGELLIPVY